MAQLNMSRFTFVFLCVLLLTQRADSQTLQPEKTWAVIVGVLEWKNTSLASYSKQNRRDQGLYDQLASMGVPKANMTLLLDEQGTHENMVKALTATSEQASEDSTFIFYYAGHGFPGRQGIYLANYDALTNSSVPEGFLVDQITQILTDKFKGKRVMLFADCCYSGGLSDVAGELSKKGYETASLTSASIANTSTGNWTFTCSLIDALNGRPLLDRNGDGVVSIQEAGNDAKDLMNYFENQNHGFALHGLKTSYQLSKVSDQPLDAQTIPQPFSMGQCVRVTVNRKTVVARVIGGNENELKLESQRYHDRNVFLHPANAVSKMERPQLPRVPSSTADFPVPLEQDEALKKAMVDGKYSNLLKKLHVKYDYLSYGEFSDFGKWDQTQYAGHKDLPPGYWVYVYPNWYIFKQLARDPK